MGAMATSTPSGPRAPDLAGIVDLERIGRGGFGTVYRGRQTDFNRTVAVKVLDGVTDDPAADQRFRREVAAMGSVSHHPNVVPVYATGVTADGHPYLVMPYLPGGSLADRLREGPLGWEEAVRLGAKVSEALCAAHGVGVLHRDVKPANILYSAFGEPQLGDFGIARLADTTRTATGLVTATVTFAPPEILSGQKAVPASDVYSLAATLHAAMRGKPPFSVTEGEPLAATVARVVTEPPPDLRPSGVPDPVATAIERAMVKDPTARTPSAEAFKDDLDAAVGQPRGGAALPPVPEATAVAAPPLSTTRIDAGPPVAPVPVVESYEGYEEYEEEEPEPPDRRGLILGVLAGVVVLGLLAFLVARALSTDGDTTAGGETTSTATTQEPTTTEATTTSESTTTTTEPTTSTTTTTEPTTSTTTTTTTTTTTVPPVNGAPGAPTPEATIDQYYNGFSGRSPEESYQWLSPAYRSRQSLAGYKAFWSGIESVSVSGVQASGDTVTATIRYVKRGGGTSVERSQLTLIRDTATGNYLINSKD